MTSAKDRIDLLQDRINKKVRANFLHDLRNGKLPIGSYLYLLMPLMLIGPLVPIAASYEIREWWSSDLVLSVVALLLVTQVMSMLFHVDRMANLWLLNGSNRDDALHLSQWQKSIVTLRTNYE